ncbi:MAG TPA: CoA transferase [Myxococcota bacterium]|nr:CoA transferase [Myxococcota bacterium]
MLRPLMLHGLRVLDLTDARAHLAGRILADLGADVVKVEPPGGDPLRRQGPWLGGVADPERGLAWLALNASKRGIALDLESAAGRETLRRLARTADVLLESDAPGAMAARGLGARELRRENPRLVHCAVTPFGQTGPYAHFRAHDLVVVALGGNPHLTGPADRPPVRCSVPTAYYHGGAEAALAVLIALLQRDVTGEGQEIDVSLHETQLQTLLSFPAQFALHRRETKRSGGRLGRLREIWTAADGDISYGLRGGPTRIRNLKATGEWMQECGEAPDWLAAYDWDHYNHNTVSDAEIARLEGAFGAFFAKRTRRELYAGALARRILLAPCNDAAEILAHEQLRSRDLFAEVPHPELGATLELPDFFAKTHDRAIRIRHRAPRLGEHQRAVLEEWASPAPFPLRAGASPDTAAGRGASALAGLRVLELGSGAAGPVATRYFVEHGAEVIRIESRRAPDFLRVLFLTPDSKLGVDGSPMFLLLNPDKRSLAVDLTRPEGVALVRRLALEWADVVSENFAPGPMEKWGLTHASLARERPDLVMSSACLFGQTGPQRHYPGFGGQGSAISGFNHLCGWPDREAHGPAHTITDSMSPRFVALGIAAALLEKRRTGRGRYLDLSQIEAAVYVQAEGIARASAAGEILGRHGNRDEHMAPHGVYPCRGDDRWIAVAVTDDAAWRRLRAELGEPDWARDPALDTAEGRLARADALDEALAKWTRAHEARALMERLQAAGIEAGLVASERDLLDDPQLAHRGHFVPVPHAELGPLQVERSGFRLSASPGGYRRPGPRLGEHGEAILREILALDDAELAGLAEVLT